MLVTRGENNSGQVVVDAFSASSPQEQASALWPDLENSGPLVAP